MMKNSKLAKLFVIFASFIYILLINGSFSFAATLSSDINGINESKYPGVKSAIQDLKRKYGNYHFEVCYTGIDWTEAITMEYQGHGRSPKNLFSQSSKYQGKWYCPICGSTKYDTGWNCASIDAIKYMMDPRNSLDETSVYQFKNLESADVSAENIQQVISNKYASYGYLNNPTIINAIVKASAQCNLNGYSILAKIFNEQGKGNSALISGNGYNGQYVGYYNFFNVGAYGNGASTVITNGLRYAQNKGWNSVENSIVGGSDYYKSQYIGRGQNTLYYQRFNVINQASLFSHQYQQDIMGAQTSATLLKSYYTISGTLATIHHTFVIPLYENMPARACSRPSTTENSAIDFEDATVLKDKLAVRAGPNSSRIVGYLNKDEKIRVVERASKTSPDGKYWDTIVSNTDGTYGYVLRSDISKKNNFPTFVFDYRYYADQHPDIKAVFGYNETKLYEHFVSNGMQEGRNSSAVFNVKYYVENNYDIKVAFGNDYLAACYHFMNNGCKEYRKSSSEYDGTFYKYYYRDLTDFDGLQLIQHYLNYGIQEGRMGGFDAVVEDILFDPTIYAEHNLDIKAALGNNNDLLKRHWLQHGIQEGRTSSIVYSPEIYKANYKDLEMAYGNNGSALLIHFAKYGISERRMASIFFDPNVYLSLYADVANEYKTDYKKVYQHFKNYGIHEGRRASAIFDVSMYVNYNADIKAAFGTNYALAIIHFLNHGIYEGRRTSWTFNINVYKATYKDLQDAYQNNYKEYYMHYLKYGKAEGRKVI